MPKRQKTDVTESFILQFAE